MPRDVDLRTADEYVQFTFGADELPSGAEEKTGSLAERALALAQLTTESLGAESAQPPVFATDGAVQTDLSGGSTVYLHQQHEGITVFHAEQTVGFTPMNTIDQTQARLVPVRGAPDLAIKVPSDQAVIIAAAHIAAPDDGDGTSADDVARALGERPLDVSSFEPSLVAVFDTLHELPTVFEAGPFAEPVRAHLVWVPVGKRLRLAWDITLTLPDDSGAFQTLVAADDGAVLFCAQVMLFAAARANVYRLDPDEAREMVELPLPWASYDVDATPGLPEQPGPWIDEDKTEGNLARAYLAETKLPVKSSFVDGTNTFDTSSALGNDQQIVNAFYGACFMHDFTYMLGFREGDGSYQQDNIVSGQSGKPVRVKISTTPVTGTANWWQGILSFGPRGTAGGPHSALDMTMVCHEYTHAVTSRLVGGGLVVNPFTAPQSHGMSEGWGDYMAVSVTGETVMGGWTADDHVKGLRRFAYDEHFPVDQANFGILATLKDYEIGELWCAFLLDMTRRIGRQLGLALVVDGMKGLLSNPSLLDGRNNLLLKLDRWGSAQLLGTAEHDAAKAGVWAAAATFGMGPAALSDGATLTGVVADSSVP